MSANSNCCGGSTTTLCDSTIAELPRYYPRQLITPDDLTLEQNYFRDRMRRHNRLLHGWGVVCGGLVCPATTKNADGTTSFNPWQVQVQQGYVLGPYGDEIILDCVRTVDLRTSGVSGVTGQPCIDAPDPWCSQVFTPPSTTNVFFIAVKYKQCMMRPVRVQPAGCGCDDAACEYSRWHDGYEIGVLSTCPVCNACDNSPTAVPPITLQTAGSLITGDCPPCPDCTCGPWVCLAQVTLNPDGSIAQIDNCSCRRLVVSLSTAWWRCTGTSITGVDVANKPVSVTPDGRPVIVTVTGNNNLEIGPDVTYSFGSGITVTQPTPASPQLPLSSVALTVVAQPNVTPGSYNLTIVNPDCSVVVVGGALNVGQQGGTSSAKGNAPPAPTGLNAPAGGGTLKPAAARARAKQSPPKPAGP